MFLNHSDVDKNDSGVYLALHSHGQQNIFSYFCRKFVKDDLQISLCHLTYHIREKKPRDSYVNPLTANPTEWSNTLKQIRLPTNCLSVFDHFVGLALKRVNITFFCY